MLTRPTSWWPTSGSTTDMTDRVVLIVLLYLIFAFALGVLIGKMIKWGREGRK